MRLREYIYILENYSSSLNPPEEKINNDLYKIVNIQFFRNNIIQLKKLPFLDPELSALLEIKEFFEFTGDIISVDAAHRTAFRERLQKLNLKINVSKDILRSLALTDDIHLISIKLPKYTDLKEMAHDIAELDKILNQALSHELLDSSYVFKNFDVGSEWLDIAVQSIPTINFIGALVWSACVIRKKKLDGDLVLKQLKIMDIKQESLTDLVNANKKLLKDLVNQEAENLSQEHNLSDGEYVQRLVYAINSLANLIQKGAEIHPSLKAPEKTEEAFPDFKMLDSIESNAKLLGDGNDRESDSQ